MFLDKTNIEGIFLPVRTVKKFFREKENNVGQK